MSKETIGINFGAQVLTKGMSKNYYRFEKNHSVYLDEQVTGIDEATVAIRSRSA